MLVEFLNESDTFKVIGLMFYCLMFLSSVVWTDRRKFSRLRHYAYNAYGVLALPLMIIPFVYIGIISNFMVALFFFILVNTRGRYISNKLGMITGLTLANFVFAWAALMLCYVYGIFPVFNILFEYGMS